MSHLYVHIPFCTHRCGYCDFVATEDLTLKNPYLDALMKEAMLLKARFNLAKQPLKTLYIGGGTPSALNAKELERLLSGLKDHFGQPSEEYTIELNPETVTTEKVALLKRYGVNRVSLGMQAKQERLLRLLERKSNFGQVDSAVGLLKGVGITRMSLDVIYGIPGQSLEDLEETLVGALALNPDHLSCYALKLECDTPMGKKEALGLLEMPVDDVVAEHLAFIVDFLRARGFERYEISNFARKGCESQHNMAYWLGTDTLGLGAGAVYLVEGVRYNNHKRISEYLDGVLRDVLPIEEIEVLSQEDYALEYLMLRLRLSAGLNLQAYEQRTGRNLLVEKKTTVDRLVAEGLMILEDAHVRLTDKGMAIEHAIILALC